YNHPTNITKINKKQMTLPTKNKTSIPHALLQKANITETNQPQQTDAHEMKLRKLLELFWNNSHPAFKETDTQLPHELTILYELVTIFYIAKHLVPEKITLQNPELR